MSPEDQDERKDEPEGKGSDDRAIDEAEEESFLASDPPSQFRFDR